MPDPIPTVAYFRRSTTKQEASLEEQRHFVQAAAQKENLLILSEFEDDIPGDEIARRQGLQNLFRFVEERFRQGQPVQVLALWDMDRLSRADSIKTAVIIDRLREAGVTSALTQEGWQDLTDETTITLHNVKQDWSRRGYAKSLSRNVARSCLERAKRGLWVGGRYPYGYVLGEDGKLALGETIRHEAVTWLFQTYAHEDTSLSRLARALEARDTPPPEYYNRKTRQRRRQSGRWTVANIQTILTNPLYLGHFHYGRSRQGKYHAVHPEGVKACRAQKTARGTRKVIPIPQEEQVFVPDNHPALVDQATFQSVQTKLKAQCPRFEPGSSRRRFDYLFSDLLRCGHCGGKMWGRTMRTHRGERVYTVRLYRCARYHQEGKSGCAHNGIREDYLLELIGYAFQDYFNRPEVVARMDALALEARREKEKASGKNKEEVERRLRELETWIRDGSGRLAKIPEDLLPGLVAQLRAWRAEAETLRQRQASSDQQHEHAEQEMNRHRALFVLLQRVDVFFQEAAPDRIRGLLREVLEEVTVYFRWEERRARRRSFFTEAHIRTRLDPNPLPPEVPFIIPVP
jgi:DNA invertase Pin-like site-specific DNA recombinase